MVQRHAGLAAGEVGGAGAREELQERRDRAEHADGRAVLVLHGEAVYGARGVIPPGWPLRSTSTSGDTAPDRTIRTLFSASSDRLTSAAAALTWTPASPDSSIGRSAARSRGVQSSLRISLFSRAVFRSNAIAASCSAGPAPSMAMILSSVDPPSRLASCCCCTRSSL